MSNHTQKLRNISGFNPSSPGSTPSASSASTQLLSSCRMQLPGTSPCAPVASFVVAGACLVGMVLWHCCFPFSESPASSVQSFLAFLLDFFFFKTREKMHPPQDRPNSCLPTQHLPNCSQRLSLESLHPSSHCSYVSLGLGKGCWWWERRVNTAPVGLCSHLWWRVRVVVIFGVSPGSVRGRLCGARPCSLLLPGWCLYLHCVPLLAILGATCHMDPWPGVGWVCATPLPFSSSSSAPCISWGSLCLLQGCVGEGFGMTTIAWSGAEQSFNSNPSSGGHRGDREEAPRAGKGLQGMIWAGQVQYSCPSLCTDPSVALGVGFESELSSRGGSVKSRGCLMFPLALLLVYSKKAGHILGTAVCQGMSPAWHWASVGLLMRLLASKLTLQAAVKTSFPRGLGYHRSIKWVLQLLPFIGVSRAV
ncbi:PREDICTED: uncharacterized protein LOC101814958 isoform X4 [Ficedula albicollis]|nr:PREDICTED: uncharacterized protein LOC101814958 isoform X3 [Ficedula albicollis]XP_016157197.1 PREDICTED: uncharacterized protein LOC101814958 isoform X4 [Ficedula albicollis]